MVNGIVWYPEIEQRYAVNPYNKLQLPVQHTDYHQCEIWSWRSEDIISEFKSRTTSVLSQDRGELARMLDWLFSWFESWTLIKLRIRIKSNPFNNERTSEFTVKVKSHSQKFKKYTEYNIPINPDLAFKLISHLSPRIQNWNDFEYWVVKSRYIVPWPDWLSWDVDVFKWPNAWLYIAEIEVKSTSTPIQLPNWAVRRMNGFKKYKPFWTAELQVVPFQYQSEKVRRVYLEAIWLSSHP